MSYRILSLRNGVGAFKMVVKTDNVKAIQAKYRVSGWTVAYVPGAKFSTFAGAKAALATL